MEMETIFCTNSICMFPWWWWWCKEVTWLCSVICHYWQDAAKRQTAGIKFTHRPKIRNSKILPPEGGRIHSVFVHKSETLDSCRFGTKMRQNAPNPISISFFSGGPPPLGLCPQTPGEGREGREGKGPGEGKGGKGEGGPGKGTGGGSLRHCRWGIDAPGLA